MDLAIMLDYDMNLKEITMTIIIICEKLHYISDTKNIKLM